MNSKILLLFVILYFIQGAVQSFFTVFQKPYLHDLNIPSPSIGILSSIILVPFILKIFTGYFCDRSFFVSKNPRKKYMVFGLVLSALFFFVASQISPNLSFLLYGGAVFFASFAITIFDVAADGYAVDVGKEQESVKIQSAMILGKVLGFVILSYLFGVLIQKYGPGSIVSFLALFPLIPLLLVSNVKESGAPKGEKFKWSKIKKEIHPEHYIFLFFAIFYSASCMGFDGIMSYFLKKEFMAEESLIGTLGSLRGIGSVVGVALSALCLKKFSFKYISLAAVLLFSIFPILAIGNLDPTSAKEFYFLWGIAWGFHECCFLTIAMQLSRISLSATFFSFSMAFANLGTAVGEGIATANIDQLGFPFVFVGLTATGIISLCFLAYFWTARLGRLNP